MIWNDRSISIQSFEIQVFSNATLKEIVRLKVFDKKQYKLAFDELLIELKENIVNQIESSKDRPDLVSWSTSVFDKFPWKSRTMTSSFLKELANGEESIKAFSFIESEVFRNKEESEPDIFISEAIFGSSWYYTEEIRQKNHAVVSYKNWSKKEGKKF